MHLLALWGARCKFNASLAALALVAMNLAAPGASAQRMSFGVVVGGYANRGFDSQYIPTPGYNPRIVQSDSGGYVVGPSLDVRLFPRLSLGVEALYKPLHYSEAASFQNDKVIGYARATVVTCVLWARAARSGIRI